MTDMSWEHATEARAALNAIVTDPEHGVAALSSAQTMSNLLKDLLPDAPREKSILVAAAEAGLAGKLREHVSQGMDANTATRLTASSFSSTTPFTPEACNWVAGEIAIALGISTPSDAGFGTEYSQNEAPTRGYARPPAQGFQQSPGQSAPQSAGQGFPQSAGQGYPQSAGQGFQQSPGQSAPQSAGQGFPQSAGQGYPQSAGQSYPQSAGQSYPQAAGPSYPQSAGQGFTQAQNQSAPQPAGPGFAQPSGPGFAQVPGQGFPQGPVAGFPQGPGQGFQPLQPGVATKNNTFAITALICGCAQFVLWFLVLIPGFLAAVAALIFGVVSLRQIKARGEAGRGMSIAGIVLGALGVLGGVIWLLIFIVAAKSPTY